MNRIFKTNHLGHNLHCWEDGRSNSVIVGVRCCSSYGIDRRYASGYNFKYDRSDSFSSHQDESISTWKSEE